MIPTILSGWTTAWPLVADHLWQSTLVAAGAALLVRGFQKSAARVRHGIWLAASMKFLVPCSLLIAVGGHLGWTIAAPAPTVTFVARTVATPFSRLGRSDASGQAARVGALGIGADMPDSVGRDRLEAGPASAAVLASVLLVAWFTGLITVVGVRCRAWRVLAQDLRGARRLTGGREHDACSKWHRAAGLRRPVTLLASTGALEPSVVGSFRPALLWPLPVSRLLDDEQLEALVVHELSHVRRRDGLTGLMHMAVEAIFWFHPVVWWMTAKLVEERERACDEAVLASGADPRRYAESLLKVGRLCLESPLPCVAGVTGSNLARRIEHIMTSDRRPSLRLGARFLLGSLATGLVIAPMAVGAMAPAPVQGVSPVAVTAPPLMAAEAPAPEPLPATATVPRPNARATVRQPDVATPSTSPSTSGISPQTAPAKPDPQTYDIGNGVASPELVTKVDPSYTPEAMAAKIEGEVWLRGVIETDGTFDQVSILKSLDSVHGLDQAAIEAAGKWRFRPGTKNGTPVRVNVQLIMEFRLKKRTPDAALPEPGASVEEPFGRGAHATDEPDLVPPAVKSRVDPTYTPDAMRAKIQGTVKLDVVILADGTVGDVRIVESLDKTFGLDDSAVRAVQAYTFEPGTLDGRPVPVIVTMTMVFRLH